MILLNDYFYVFSCHPWWFDYSFSSQSAPTASIAADIVYRYVPSATCVSEVHAFMLLYLY